MHPRPQTVFPTSDLDRPVPDPSRPDRIRQLEDSITELAAHIDAATCHWLELVREYDDSGAWAGPGLKSCAHWLNWKCGLRLGAARERVRVAHALHELPAIRDAFREGRVSYSKVRAMSRVATPATEERLLRIALCGTATHVERVVQQFRRARRAEALAEESRRHELRELHWCIDSDGCFVLRGRFTPEQGAVIRKALDTVLEEQFAEREHASVGTTNAGGPAGSPDCLPPVASRRADALAHIAELALDSAANRTASPADRFLVHVHASIDALREDGSGACCSGATAAAGSRAAAQRASSMRTTYTTGPMAAKPISATWFCCAGIITGWFTKADSDSNGCRAGHSGSRVLTEKRSRIALKCVPAGTFCSCGASTTKTASGSHRKRLFPLGTASLSTSRSLCQDSADVIEGL